MIETEQMPCDGCKQLIAADTHEDELGMCLECSQRFWDHATDGHQCSWGCVATAALPREERL